MPSVEPPELARPRYLTGVEREKYAEYVSALYTADGMTCREIAHFTGRGYGVIHDLLKESGTPMRPEGRPMGKSMHKQREGTEEVIEALEGVVEEKRDGEWRPVE